jgi:hypothetical protein
MGVDDHCIDAIKVWLDLAVSDLKEEVDSGDYSKLSDCPSFKAVKAYREAMNVLIKALYLPEYYDSHKVNYWDSASSLAGALVHVRNFRCFS